MSKYRLLTIDGGGIRGLITTILLQRLTEEPGLEDLLDKVDLVAGTSTGGLLALGIAGGFDLETIRDIYVDSGPKIFDDSWLDNLLDLGKLRGADYRTAPLRRALRKVFQKRMLGDLEKNVLITTFDLDDGAEENPQWKPKLFHNFEGENSDNETEVVDAGLYTSAAPTFFPSVDGYIDGGVYANNPAMCALAQTQDERYSPNPSMQDIVMLSMGTGKNLQRIGGKRHDWGYAQWVRPLISLMLDGTVGIADYQCKQMLRDRYHRIAPVFPHGVSVPLDDVGNIPYMIEFANEWPLEKSVEWLKENW